MEKIRKSLLLIPVLILFFLSLTIVTIKPTYAQSLPIPIFTVKVIDGSYTFPTTHSIDPYTGAEITNGGYRSSQEMSQLQFKMCLKPTGICLSIRDTIPLNGFQFIHGVLT